MPVVPFIMTTQYCGQCEFLEDKKVKAIAMVADEDEFCCANCICYMNYIQEKEKEEPIVWVWFKNFWE